MKVLLDLYVDQGVLDVVFGQILAVQEIVVHIISGNGALGLLGAESIHHEVARYAVQPCRELAHIIVSALSDSCDSLDESLLKYIVGQIAVAYHLEYIAEQPLAIPHKQSIERQVVTVSVSRHQLLVGELCKIAHFLFYF